MVQEEIPLQNYNGLYLYMRNQRYEWLIGIDSKIEQYFAKLMLEKQNGMCNVCKTNNE